MSQEQGRFGLRDAFWGSYISRGVTAESKINESVQWTVETQAKIQRHQALNVMIGGVVALACMTAYGSQAGWILNLDLHPEDYVIAGCLVSLAFVGAFALVRHFAPSPRDAITIMTALLIVMVLGGAIVVAAASRRNGFSWLPWGIIMLSVPGVIAGGALFINQLSALLDPYGKTSPTERQLMPYIQAYLRGERMEENGGATVRLIPSRSGNGISAISQTEGDVELDPESIDLINFIKTAKFLGERNRSSGLAVSDWLPAKKNLFGRTVRQEWANPWSENGKTRVGKTKYRELIDLCSKWGFIEKGGGGHAAAWKIQPARALQILEDEIKRQLGEREDD